jgi:hypothetical protein
MNAHARIAVAAAVVLAASCGPKHGNLTVNKPWDPDYAEYFDDSVDFTVNPGSLSGQWMYSYRLELEGRVSLSDYIVALRVQSVSVEEDGDGRQVKGLHTVLEKSVKGDFPGKSVTLTVSDDQPGFDSFSEDDSRLTDKVFLAFLRLYKDEEDRVGIHWHLSPLSKGLMKAMDEIRKAEEAAQKGGEDEGFTLEKDEEGSEEDSGDEPAEE